jgi:hypothetical protein
MSLCLTTPIHMVSITSHANTYKRRNQGTVSSATRSVPLTRIGYKATDDQVNAVRRRQTFAYACWLLHYFSGLREHNNFGWPANFFSDLIIFLSRGFLYREMSQERNHRVTAGKGIVPLIAGHEGPEAEYKYSSTLSLTSAIDGWVVNITLLPLYPRERDPVPIS